MLIRNNKRCQRSDRGGHAGQLDAESSFIDERSLLDRGKFAGEKLRGGIGSNDENTGEYPYHTHVHIDVALQINLEK